ncbi:MAG: hypothetical protein JMDDDDMK_05689 [Acidobacteria bacterium]|nr:hypothetical protein [Acidobacteriota bacterium]
MWINLQRRNRTLREFGQAKVEDFDEAVWPQHHVLRFDVAMRYPDAVRRVERRCDLNGDLHGLGQQQTPARKFLTQRDAFDQLSGDEASAAVHTNVVNREDVRMVEGRRRASLTLEPPRAIGVRGKFGGQQLERDLAIQPLVSGRVDFAHPAFAQKRNDLEMADALACERWRVVFNKQRRGHGVGGRFDQTPSFSIGRQQRLDLAAQGFVIAARLADKSRAIFGRAFERRLEQLIHLSPSLRLHSFPALRWNSP